MERNNIQDRQDMHPISAIWRGKTFIVEMNSHATLRDLGDELQNLTHVKVDTMRFIVPQSSNQSSKLFTPFSYEHECLSLKETSIIEAKAIRMMGVPEKEIDEILQAANANLRIAGFDEEEKRLRQRFSEKPHSSLRLPQGPYIFCDFRTLQLPGVELNPPPSEALKRMHMLAADPGIVAIMNKHRWRVGIMTEMAPVGYVGISPKCLLGFNKNHGEEISMRLRTDDLKGFRKYESIKKTLLHELAHMVFSEHDANFYALDKQLNHEAASLDWTSSRSHTLSGVRHSEDYEEDFHVEGNNFSHKLGGNILDQLANARTTSVAAAYRRLENASLSSLETSHVHEEPDPDDSEFQRYEQPNCIDSIRKEDMHIDSSNKVQGNPYQEPDPDDHSDYHKTFEPDPDGYSDDQVLEYPHKILDESTMLEAFSSSEEPDPDNLESFKHSAAPESESEPETFKSIMDILGTTFLAEKNTDEPDPDDMEVRNLKHGNVARLTEDDSLVSRVPNGQSQLRNDYRDSASESQAYGAVQAELYPQDNPVNPLEMSRMQIDEPDPVDEELLRIQDPVTVVCTRLKKAIDMLQDEVNPKQATIVVETLFKIIRNVIEHPSQLKYRRLRKNNPIIQSNVANYKAAMEFLFLIGFSEDVVADEIGKAETFLVLKRNDPGLLWLAKSSLETLITC